MKEINEETFESYIHSVECGLVGGNKFDWKAVLRISKQLHDKEIKELQAEVERLSNLCFKKESELMDLKDLIPIKNKIKRVII